MTKLKRDKASVLNKVPLNAFKALNNDNLTHLLEFFNKYWLEETGFDECHEGQILPVTKSGDLSDPKKWRVIILMDIGANIFIRILCEHELHIIK